MTRPETTAQPRAAVPWSPPGTGSVLTAVGVWLLLACLVGASGRLSAVQPPGPQLVLGWLTIALLVAARLWSPLRRFVETVDLRALVLFHVTRFVGFYFLVLYARGELPWAFAVRPTSDTQALPAAVSRPNRSRPPTPFPLARRMPILGSGPLDLRSAPRCSTSVVPDVPTRL